MFGGELEEDFVAGPFGVAPAEDVGFFAEEGVDDTEVLFPRG